MKLGQRIEIKCTQEKGKRMIETNETRKLNTKWKMNKDHGKMKKKQQHKNMRIEEDNKEERKKKVKM